MIKTEDTNTLFENKHFKVNLVPIHKREMYLDGGTERVYCAYEVRNISTGVAEAGSNCLVNCLVAAELWNSVIENETYLIPSPPTSPAPSSTVGKLLNFTGKSTPNAGTGTLQ